MSGAGSADPGFRTLADLEAAASRRLSTALWDYVQGGAGEERTLRGNRGAFERRTLWPKALGGIRRIEVGTSLLGTPVRVPFFVAPTAYQGELHPDGERAVVRAAGSAGVLACISTLSTFPLETIASEALGPLWFQLYLQPEFAQTERLVRRAESAGYRALVLTADVPLLGIRDRQAREGFALDTSIGSGSGPEFVAPARAPEPSGSGYSLRADAAADWGVLDRLAAISDLPIVVKGLLRPEDARAAFDHGAAAIVVSNHGGRQLDGAPASLDALADIVAAVRARGEIYLDGGVRRAADIVVALALGARAVGLGRPILWALAAGGEAGVARYLALLEAELVNTMAQIGCGALTELGPAQVRV